MAAKQTFTYIVRRGEPASQSDRQTGHLFIGLGVGVDQIEVRPHDRAGTAKKEFHL
jgi:hypothetical protein